MNENEPKQNKQSPQEQKRWLSVDFYGVLGVQRGASSEEIKKRYRGLARILHPDVNLDKSAEERMKNVNEAYDVLSDPQKRDKYNRLRNQKSTPPDNINTGDIFSAFWKDFDFGVSGFPQQKNPEKRDLKQEAIDAIRSQAVYGSSYVLSEIQKWVGQKTITLKEIMGRINLKKFAIESIVGSLLHGSP